jgi:multidrug transporter EmrE-like cation transporter
VPTVALILVSVLLGVIGQLILKNAVTRIGPLALGGSGPLGVAWRIGSSPRIWAGLALYGASTFLWLVALSQVELGFAYPFLSLSYVLIALSSWLFFDEEIGLWRVIGVAAICVGVIAATGF